MKTREIKFRGWHTGANKMFSAEEMAADQLTLLPTGCFINVSGNSTRLSEIYPNDKFIPLQFTGLHDKTGKEIYEGDVVELFWPFAGATYRCKVFWLTERGCWAMARDKGKATYNGIFHYFGDQDTNLMDIEVIGNIYEGIKVVE